MELWILNWLDNLIAVLDSFEVFFKLSFIKIFIKILYENYYLHNKEIIVCWASFPYWL